MTALNQNIFADLNILHDPSNPKLSSETVKMAVALGFDSLAINTELLDVGETILEVNTPSTSSGKGSKTQKGKRQKIKTIPEPFILNLDHIDQSSLFQNGKKLRLYTRLTLGLDDPSMIHNILKHPVVLKYDILAVYPKTEQIFNTVINKTDIDMIAIDMTEKNMWVSKKNLVQKAVESGITFEMTYSQALTDSSVRRDVFASGRDLFRATKGKGLMFNSRATKPIELRSPFDVANLAVLFGMTIEQGRRTISRAPKQLLLRVESKKSIKGVMHVENIDSIASNKLNKLLTIPEFRAEVQVATDDKNIETEEKSLTEPAAKKKKIC